MGDLHVLDAPVMTSREAARQLNLSPTTLANWLEGNHNRGRSYDPILRPERLGHLNMTWGEVVEAGFLRVYRNHVSLQRLRPFVALLRQEFHVPYPLAHFKPFVDGKRGFLLELQQAADLPDDLWLVTKGPHGQFVLNPAVEREYLDTLDFAREGLQEAERIRPLGEGTDVVIDPLRSSGAASIRGVRCEVLAERVNVGEHIDDVAEEFNLTPALVRQALSFMWRTAA